MRTVLPNRAGPLDLPSLGGSTPRGRPGRTPPTPWGTFVSCGSCGSSGSIGLQAGLDWSMQSNAASFAKIVARSLHSHYIFWDFLRFPAPVVAPDFPVSGSDRLVHSIRADHADHADPSDQPDWPGPLASHEPGCTLGYSLGCLHQVNHKADQALDLTSEQPCESPRS